MICILKMIHYYWLFLKTLESKMCFEIYELGPAQFPSAPGLAWQAA